VTVLYHLGYGLALGWAIWRLSPRALHGE